MAHFMCSELLATGLDSRDQFRKDTKMEPDGTKDEIMEDAAEDDDEGRPADEIESDTENDGGDVLPEFQHIRTKFASAFTEPCRSRPGPVLPARKRLRQKVSISQGFDGNSTSAYIGNRKYNSHDLHLFDIDVF